MNKLRLPILAAVLAACSGCATIQGLWDKYVKPEIEKPDQPEQPQNDIPDGTIWLHHDVSSWPITTTLNASIGGSSVKLAYDKSRVWPGRNTTAGDNLNANPWVFVQHGGTWYAATWEWLRYGQTSKGRYALNGDHIKRAPLNNWTPSKGERIGLMVSGLARHVERNVQERSNIVWMEIP